MSSFSGTCRFYDSKTGTELLLDGCSAQALITDVHAFVTLSQKFTNKNAQSSALGVYTFAMMADAAVCGFEMVRGDGTKVEGLVKEKQEAKRDYEKAISEGHTAGLGQQETGDGKHKYLD